MRKTKINPINLPIPTVMCSQGIRVDIGDTAFIFVSGQVAIDKNGKLVGKDDITRQTEFVFERINSILASGGFTLGDVIKATIYVTDMSLFPKVSEVRNRFLAESQPATTGIEVTKLARDGCMVEIEVIAAT